MKFRLGFIIAIIILGVVSAPPVFARNFVIRDVTNVNNVFFQVTGSTGYIGIASSSPGYTLTTVGTGYFSQPVIVGTPTADSHAATKSYVDTAIPTSSGWTKSGTNIYPTTLTNNIGIGTTNPGAKITIRSVNDVNSGIKFEDSAGTYARNVYFNSSGELNFYSVSFGNPYLSQAGVWTSASDRSFKENIADMKKYGLETVLQLRPREYTVKGTGLAQIGFVAQEVKGLIPELVSGEEGKMGFSYDQLTAVLAKAIQELKAENDDLKLRLKTIEVELQSGSVVR